MSRDFNISVPNPLQPTQEVIPNHGNILRLEQANELLTSAYLANFIYAIAVLIYTYEMDFEGNMKSVIYCVFSKLILQILHQCHFYKVFRSLNVNYYQNIVRIMELFFECCFVAILNIFVEKHTNELLLISIIFPALNILLSIILKMNETNKLFKQSIHYHNMFYVFRHICIFIISLFVCLRLGGYFDIDWVYTLWMFWILFSLSGSITFYYVFVVLALCIQVILEQNNRQKYFVLTNIWILFFMISSSIMLFLVPISLMHFYDLGNYGQLIDVLKIVLIVNQVIFSYFTTKYKLELLNWLQSYLSQYDLVTPHQSLPTQQEIQLQLHKQDVAESQPSEGIIQIPRLVKRISKTYFGFEDQNSQKRTETEAVRRPTHQKALSSQIQKPGDNDKIKLTSLMNIKFHDGQDIDETPGSEQKKQEEKPEQPPFNQSFSISSFNACCICYDKEPNAIFMKCGHGGICYHCAIDMWKNKDECYLCRNKILCVLQISQTEKSSNLFKVVTATEMNKKEKVDLNRLSQQFEQP